MCEIKNIIDGKAAKLVSVWLAEDLIDEHCLDAERGKLVGEVVARVKSKYPIASKIWVSDHMRLRDGSFSVLCNGREVAGYLLEPGDDFLECLEQCLLSVMERYHCQITKLESQRDPWWRRAVSGRRLGRRK